MNKNNILPLFQAQDNNTLLILFTLPLLFLFIITRSFRQYKPYPPGPKGWPLIGNMAMINQLTHRGLAKLAKQYSGILHLRIGFRHTIVVSSPDMAREVLQVQDSIFANRPASIAITYLTYDRADMAFAHYGPFWREMRKLCVIKLFSRKRAESWDSVRDEVDQMMRSVGASSGKAVNVGELVFGLTKKIIYRAAFRSRSHEGQDEFIKILQEFSKLFGAFNIADFIPVLGWADPQRLSYRLAEARAKLDGFIDMIIDDHMDKKNGCDHGDDDTDMVDELLSFYGDEVNVSESEDLQNSIKLGRDNIKAIIMDVMFGGTETVASAIEWTMSELLKSPQDLKRVQQELTDVVGLTRKVQEPDLQNLTYLRCCIKETLRLHPPNPHSPPRDRKRCCRFGLHVPWKHNK